MRKLLTIVLAGMLLFSACKNKKEESVSAIDQTTVASVISTLKEGVSDAAVLSRIDRAVPQVAALWTAEDGTPDEFKEFCVKYFVADSAARWELANTIQQNLESLWGCYNKISVDLKLHLHVTGPEITDIDELFGSFDPYAHLNDDMYAQKIAFITVLNFPFYTLQEKDELGKTWTRQEWAYARLGDLFTSRVPASCNQNSAIALQSADSYISAYNIYMGNLVDDQGTHLFPKEVGGQPLALITHWGLRDELKSNYADAQNGLAKQRMIYQVMRRIIDQSIPQCVINNDEFDWNPYQNTVSKGDKKVSSEAEPDTRYQHLLDNFHAELLADKYNPIYPTYIQRAFDGGMEVSVDEIEQLFTTFVSSPQVKEVAALIEQRLGRKLEPFDIWYDGFKSRSSISEDELTAKTQKRYPDKEAVKADLPNILVKLGFTRDMANYICDKVTVDPSRGAGHAWEAAMKTDKARLRTRIGENGMDYKGYNIAVHEFGHNVEQTLTLYNVDNYIMKGVPNTAFTEALAFVFQMRDLELLGYKNNDPDKDALNTLDIFWGCYEIMGVSLVDINVWKWMYAHPDATKAELKAQVMQIARDIWNQYYEPVLGEKDSPILAIYSHMVDSPLYLANYPYGHIIEFQLEQQLQGKNIADEILRMFPVGRLTPQNWMRHAVGSEVSTQPLLDAAELAVKVVGK